MDIADALSARGEICSAPHRTVRRIRRIVYKSDMRALSTAMNCISSALPTEEDFHNGILSIVGAYLTAT